MTVAMRSRLRLLRGLVAVALPCWFVTGPLSVTLQGVAACRHHVAQHQGMRHHRAPDAPAPPCWCDDMTGGGASLAPIAPALLPGPTVAPVAVPLAIVRVAPGPTPLPDSPSFAPTPPPPNQAAL